MNKWRDPTCDAGLVAARHKAHIQNAGLVRLGEAAASAAAGGEGALDRIRQTSRGLAGAARLRQRAMYLAHVGLGVSLTGTGLGLGRDRTTVRHGCMLVEEERVDPVCDLALAALEWGVRAQAGAWLGWRPVQEVPCHD